MTMQEIDKLRAIADVSIGERRTLQEMYQQTHSAQVYMALQLQELVIEKREDAIIRALNVWWSQEPRCQPDYSPYRMRRDLK